MAQTGTMSDLTSELTSDGQITMPLEIREHFGLRAGDRVKFAVDQDRIVIRPSRPEDNPFLKYAGALPAFESVEEINAWVGEMRDGEEATAK